MSAAPYQADDLKLQEEDMCRKLEAKKAEETRQNFEAQLQQQRAELERLSGVVANLRAERDRVIMVGRLAGCGLLLVLKSKHRLSVCHPECGLFASIGASVAAMLSCCCVVHCLRSWVRS